MDILELKNEILYGPSSDEESKKNTYGTSSSTPILLLEYEKKIRVYSYFYVGISDKVQIK
jgi:hypothetical protein